MRYTMLERCPKEGGAQVSEVLAALRKAQIPPEVLRKLGLPPDWNQHVSKQFIQQIISYIDRYKGTFEELAKR